MIRTHVRIDVRTVPAARIAARDDRPRPPTPRASGVTRRRVRGSCRGATCSEPAQPDSPVPRSPPHPTPAKARRALPRVQARRSARPPRVRAGLGAAARLARHPRDAGPRAGRGRHLPAGRRRRSGGDHRRCGWTPCARPEPAAVRRVFDLDHDPAALADALATSRCVAPLARAPGIRVPGTWSGFEIAVRAVLGQQVSVAGARETSGQIARRARDGRRAGLPHRSRRRRPSPTARCPACRVPASARCGRSPRRSPAVCGSIRRSTRGGPDRAAGAAGHRPLDRRLRCDARAARSRRVAGRRLWLRRTAAGGPPTPGDRGAPMPRCCCGRREPIRPPRPRSPLRVPPPRQQIAEDHEVAPVGGDHLPVAAAQRRIRPPAILHQPRLAHGVHHAAVDGVGRPPSALSTCTGRGAASRRGPRAAVTDPTGQARGAAPAPASRDRPG